jgi:type IV pilus assembly protein PilB
MLRKKRKEERLGEILIKQDKIADSQLEEALKVQKEEGGLLGEILIKLGLVSEREIAQAIASQYAFPFIPLANYDINDEAVGLVPEFISRKHQTVPFDVIGDILIVAMTNPLNNSAITEIEENSKKKVQVYIGIASEIMETINKVYSKQN